MALRSYALSLASLLLVVGACASSGAPTKERPLTPLAELPEAYGEAWRAYRTRDPEWAVLREQALDDPELAQFLVDNFLRDLVNAYDRSRLAAAGRADGPFERARAELITFQEHSVPVLVELVRVGDGVVSFLARDLLVEIGAPSTATALSLFDDPDERVRQRAAELFVELPGPLRASQGDEAAVLARLKAELEADPSWVVRALCARALGRRGAGLADPRPARIGLLGALDDEDGKVRETAAEALLVLGDPRAVPGLIEAFEHGLEQGDLATMRAARSSLRGLCGVERKTPDDWRRFWDENRRDLIEAAAARRRGSGDG